MAIPDNVKSAVERLIDAIKGLGKEVQKSKSEGTLVLAEDSAEIDSMIVETIEEIRELLTQEE
jgi:hypothetical protein